MKKLRRQIREARSEIDPRYAQQASYKFSEHIGSLEWYQAATKIGAYLPFEGEADPHPLMDRAIQEGKEVFVPIIIAKDQPLKFAAWGRNANTKKNSFGIEEPDVPANKLLTGTELDFVVTPLVGFDDDCNRLGVGGGFYDRTFESLREIRTEDRRTKLVGIAFELQNVGTLQPESWDVPLDGVVTELKIRLSS